VPVQHPPLELNPDFQHALDLMEKSREHLFITGRAGTGKSTLLTLFRNTSHKKVIVLAPTGIAAINVKGQTIHSFFGFSPRLMQAHEIKKRKYRNLYRKIDTIVIDEISMVRADILDHIDRFLRINRDNSAPFGGVQMIFFGDLFQLPPVVSSDVEKHYFSSTYSSPYFFSSQILESGLSYRMVELRKIYRQEERHFIQLLEAIRTNSMDYDDLESLNERYQPTEQEEGPTITLCSMNAIADKINQARLAELNGNMEEYRANVTGDFHERLFPTEAFLALKTGAQVMLLKNDPNKKYVNGTIGKILRLLPDKIILGVEQEDEKVEEIEVEKHEWEILKYNINEKEDHKIESKVVGTFNQYPVKLAWAITIHKSQGKTFNRVMIDLGRGAFAHGQTYVALSRCRRLGGVTLKQRIKPRDIMIDERIVEYYEMMRRYST
jgi:ATP-dependent exoDNAse (exonuclease V) alpha subunit